MSIAELKKKRIQGDVFMQDFEFHASKLQRLGAAIWYCLSASDVKECYEFCDMLYARGIDPTKAEWKVLLAEAEPWYEYQAKRAAFVPNPSGGGAIGEHRSQSHIILFNSSKS